MKYKFKKIEEKFIGYFSCGNCLLRSNIVIQDLSIIDNKGICLSTCLPCYNIIKKKLGIKK